MPKNTKTAREHHANPTTQRDVITDLDRRTYILGTKKVVGEEGMEEENYVCSNPLPVFTNYV